MERSKRGAKTYTEQALLARARSTRSLDFFSGVFRFAHVSQSLRDKRPSSPNRALGHAEIAR